MKSTGVPNQVMNSHLSIARRELVELMQHLWHGTIGGFSVRNGEPVLHPPPGMVTQLKLGSDKRPMHTTGDFLLKSKVTELFDHFDRLQDLRVQDLEVQDGLPFRLCVEGEAWPS